MDTNAHEYGFSPDATGSANAEALQRATDRGGRIVVARPGTYDIARTVYVGSNTTLSFGAGVRLRKVDEEGEFSHVLLNKGALAKTWDENIVVEGLSIVVNGVDARVWQVFGLHGQIAFFYVRDLRIERFRCLDLGPKQYAVHICTFEDVTVHDAVIHGDKDGIHFGRGRRFTVRDCVFKCFDDAVALNAHDYDVGNPEIGWIEDGVVENCHDLDADRTTGFFCRIIAGAWKEWEPGMRVQKSDTVVSAGRIYRVKGDPDGTFRESRTPPTHAGGSEVLDGITWVMTQEDTTTTAGVRNVMFRDIFLRKPRVGFSIYFHNDRFHRAYIPGSEYPVQRQLTFDNIRVLHDQPVDFIESESQVDVLTITHCSLRDSPIRFRRDPDVKELGRTVVNMMGCVFNTSGTMDLIVNEAEGKEIALKTSASVEIAPDFVAQVIHGPGSVVVESDLTGLSGGMLPSTE